MDELKIIQYLDGDMNAEESRAFEEEIRMNPPLAGEVEKYRQIQDLARKFLRDGEAEADLEKAADRPDPDIDREISDAVRDYKEDSGSFSKVSREYRQKLEAAQDRFLDSRGTNDERDRIQPVRMIRRIWYRAAAIIILAIILSILIFKPFEKMTAEEIYAEYFHTFHKTEQVMEMARADNDFLFAVEVYEAGDYDRAIILFEMLADSAALRSWSLFYTACSYMSINQSAEAIELFRKVILDGDEAVVPHARWQLALSYIRTGKPKLGREQLEILSIDPLYRSDARRIMRIVY